MAYWIASKLIPQDYWEELLGDLDEIYQDRKESSGPLIAHLMYWVEMTHLLFGFSRLFKQKTQNRSLMILSNMTKIAWRNAVRHKQFSILNIAGLTMGMTACLLLSLFIYDEMNYDTFHDKADRIYRVNQPNIWGDWNSQSSFTGPNVATALKTDLPEFEQITRLMNLGPQVVRKKSTDQMTSYQEDHFFAADHNFFSVFSFEFISGDPKTIFDEPLSMILTQEAAHKYFGYEEAVGRSLEVKNWDGKWISYLVRGIVKNIPTQSHIQFEFLISERSRQKRIDRDGWKWIWTTFSTYGLVKEGTDIANLTEKMQAIPPKWAAPTTERIFNQTFEEFTAGHPWTLTLQPLNEIYLSSAPDYHRFGPTGNPLFVQIFVTLGIIVLLISSINFMNLSTAKSSKRAKEVGVRKVLGSSKAALMQQFVYESILTVAVSTAIALVVVELSLDSFNHLADKKLSLATFLLDPIFIICIILFVLTLGIVAGSYPAFYLSSFRPIETLKGKMTNGLKGKKLRNGLVIFQFSLSITLIICSFFVQKQLSYASNLDLGMSQDQVLQLHNIEQLGFDTEVLKSQLKENPAFAKVGKSFGVPPHIWTGDRYHAFGPDQPVLQFRNLRTESDYLEVLDVQFVAGRNFDESKDRDKYKVILNEEAVKVLGWGATKDYAIHSPIGKKVALASGKEKDFEVIGVVKNFNISSTKHKIPPLIIIHHLNDQVWDYGAGDSFFSIKLNTSTIGDTETLQALIEDTKKTILSIDPSFTFKYSFMDEEFNKTYAAEKTMNTVLKVFTAMAIIVACLGLFGLAAFSAEQRTKELGIRKTLGASAIHLILLFLTEFAKLIGIAIIVASPIAYFAIDTWLEDFAYKTPIELWVFALAALSTVTIAAFTIGYQSIFVATKNPIESLKDH